MFHWLADQKASTPSSVFQIEDGDALTMLIYESKAPFPIDINLNLSNEFNPNVSKGSYNLICDGTTRVNKWGFSTWTAAGASNLIGGTAVLAYLLTIF